MMSASLACSEEPVSEVSDWGLELVPLPPSSWNRSKLEPRSLVKSMVLATGLALPATLEFEVLALFRSTPAIAELISEVTDGQGEGAGEFSVKGAKSRCAGLFPACASDASLWSFT